MCFWYPAHKSILENHSSLYNSQNLQVLSFFCTSSTGEEKGLWLTWIMEESSIFLTSFSITSFLPWECLYGQGLTGLVPSSSGIQWSHSLLGGSWVGSAKTASNSSDKSCTTGWISSSFCSCPWIANNWATSPWTCWYRAFSTYSAISIFNSTPDYQ